MFSVTMSTTSVSMCDKHVQEEVRFYCRNCNTTLRDDCIPGQHKYHDFIKLKEFGTQKRSSLLTNLRAAKESKTLETRAAKIKDVKGKLEIEKSIE